MRSIQCQALRFCGVLGVAWLAAGCDRVDLRGAMGRASGDAREMAGMAVERTEPLTPDQLVGRSDDIVKKILGQPHGRLRTEAGEVWLYPDWRVTLGSDDRVALVEAEKPVEVAGQSAGGAEPMAVNVVRAGGAVVDLRRYLSSGKVVLVDFYADWCGPCRQMSPLLERMVESDPNLMLVKVDIVDWDTPVTRQFEVEFVPNVRVFNRQGKPVGKPTADWGEVQRLVELARR
ncbi:MAG: thioredoxin family protein [Limisphaerales bacterium]|jgi:thioredoxin 1